MKTPMSSTQRIWQELNMGDETDDIYLNIKNLLPTEVQNSLPVFCCPESCEDAANRCIVDAARELLDIAGTQIYPTISDGWGWVAKHSVPSRRYDTRVEAIYHALKCLHRGENTK